MTTPPPGGAALGALRADTALVRAVATLALTAAIVNVTVGGGIFRAPSVLYAAMGAGAPLAFLAGAVAILPIALCFAVAGSRVGATGGPYSYTAAAFGTFAGFVAGALMWITNVASSAGISPALIDQIGNVVPAIATPGLRTATLVVLYAILIALNAFGVKLGARAIVALATLKLTPLFLLAGIGLWFVDWSQISVAVPSWAALGTSMVLVMFAYSGMETALIPSGEVRDPARDVPRATLFFASKLRSLSLEEDKSGNNSFAQHKKMRVYAAVFLPIIGFTSAAMLWQWVMSVDAHWYSTLFAWYSTASAFVSMISLTILLIIFLKSTGYYGEVNSNHIHDLGKFLFAISVF